MQKKWIPQNMKRGALSKQLNIREKDKIPKTLLDKIVKTEKGKKIENPTQKGKRQITVTTKLKRRAVCALNLKAIAKGKAK
jgi:hypothetical protein